MKRILAPLVALALGLAAGGAADASTDLARIADTTRGILRTSSGSVTLTADAGRAAVRRQIQRAAQGTYIGEMLRGRDSSLARWPDRRGTPLRVWIEPWSDVADWREDYVDSVRAAFREWNRVDLPVSFVFVDERGDADVQVTFVDRFHDPISGRTKWARDDDWWITDGDITLAVHHHQGGVLAGDAMKAMALHEIGHLLGLDHTENAGSIMAPRVRVRGLAQVDVATARLLYTLPAGVVR